MANKHACQRNHVLNFLFFFFSMLLTHDLQVDIAYAPFVERFQIFLQDVWKYDITAGRPKLATWIEEVNKIDAYKPTKGDPEFLIQNYRQRFLGQ
ncbi:hypothetical protein RHGRI_015108 [Rhododendron griersonianum]|uniref:Glutathione S-transferase n=1 Tax=Rhododendron griersonianum TaxID=479676 RepID=A0AAV6KCF0_9ERIC|nr:hypothetical protein RHGRI_015108 [Rhododendron griersonianum]